MKSSNLYRSWSVRPEELLIESARDYLVAQTASADTVAWSSGAQPRRAAATTPTPVHSLLTALGQQLGRCRRLGLPAAAVPGRRC
jgi:hypothetical protein